MISTNSDTEISHFKTSLFKMGKDRRNLVQNSSECMRKAEEGEVIVIKGNPFYAAFFLIITVTFAVTTSAVFSFDLGTVLMSYSPGLAITLYFYFSARNKLLVLHPEGFLFRKNFFFKYCQKWRNLTSPPQFETVFDYPGKRWDRLIFTDTWGIKKFEISNLKIKDIRYRKQRLQFLWEITSKYFERSNLT